jgi:hypothetical protein
MLRRRAVKRLTSDISASIEQLGCHAQCMKSVPLLEKAREVAEDGDVDLGWKYLQTARRLELAASGSAELAVAAISLGKEADSKLASWRKDAVKELLKTTGASTPDSRKICEAARHCDEHFNNEAYKDGLRRSNALRLAILLFVALVLLFWSGSVEYLQAAIKRPTPNVLDFKVLVGVAVVGFLGAVVSAITDVAKPGAPTRIPELVSTLRITILRLLMGPASAIFLYFVTQTELAKTIFQSGVSDGGYIILVIAFVAGFSERLVLRVVQSFDDKSSK